MQVYNTTYADSADVAVATYHLNSSSAFYDTNSDGYYYILTARFLDWFQIVSGNSYKIRLSWVNPNNSLDTQSVEYTWTMSLTAEQELTEEQKTQQEINQGINNLNNNISDLNNSQQETNNFLKDDTIDDNEIVSNMPTFGDYFDPSESGIGNIFNSLRTAFTTNQQGQDVVFPLPHGGSIVIPANVTSSKIPPLLVGLIRSVYWFLIARYIIKDVSSYVEKAKSGEILDSTDGNIKTDLL